MHRAHSLTHSKDSIRRSDYYYINRSIVRRLNDSALETSSLVVDIADSGGTCFLRLLATGLWENHMTFLCLVSSFAKQRL